MGNLSWLKALRNNPQGCIIDWDGMDLSKLYKDCHMEYEHKKPVGERAKTLADMSRVWDDTKFVGYFGKEYIESLTEFTKHLIPYGSHPRLYYEYEGWEELWYLEFIPGTEVINYGICKFGEHMKGAPKHPEELSKSYTGEDEDKWSESFSEFKTALFERLIDGGVWSISRRLVHVEMSESVQLAMLWARLYGTV